MKRLFKKLAIFIQGVAIETLRRASTSERGFQESPGLLVSLGRQSMEEARAVALGLT